MKRGGGGVGQTDQSAGGELKVIFGFKMPGLDKRDRVCESTRGMNNNI